MRAQSLPCILSYNEYIYSNHWEEEPKQSIVILQRNLKYESVIRHLEMAAILKGNQAFT